MRALGGVLFLIGFTAVTSQVVLLRELLVMSGGNEVSLGWMLASWLVWTALGSGVAGRIRASPARLTAALFAGIALVLPITILAARSARIALHAVPGEILGPGWLALAAAAVLGPFCILSGWLFAAGSRLYHDKAGALLATATGTVYLLEAAGWAVGGVLASVVLLRLLDPMQIALFVALLNLAAAAHLAMERRLWRLAALGALTGIFGVYLIPTWAPKLEVASLARLWSPFAILATASSPYGNLVLAGTEGARTLYENGLPVATIPDQEAAEEAVHFALLQHAAPESLLLIGGGLNGSLAEALKHPSLQRVDYVELDPEIVPLIARSIPVAGLRDPKVHLHNTDGRLFLQNSPAAFDVIIVNLPDPQTAQINRFYTLEFFREAAARLRSGGVLSLRLTSSENYISPALAELLRSIHLTLRTAFRQVAFLPGPTAHFFASNTSAGLLARSEQYLERLRARGIRTSYVGEDYLPFRMSPERMDQLATAIAPQPGTRINRDLTPIAYYFDAVLWSTRFGRGSSGLVGRLATVGFEWLLGAVAAAGLLCLLLTRRAAGAAVISTGATGFAMMGLEILLLLGFQAIHGSLYHQLALLIAMFMAGMAAGSWLALLTRRGTDRRRLLWIQSIVTAAPLVVCLGLQGPLQTSPAFGALAFLTGLAGGYQFCIASRIFFAGVDGPGRGMGTLYAIDLAGSAAGAVLVSAWLVPVFGFWKTGLAISALSLASLLVVWLRGRGTPAP